MHTHMHRHGHTYIHIYVFRETHMQIHIYELGHLLNVKSLIKDITIPNSMMGHPTKMLIYMHACMYIYALYVHTRTDT